MRWCRLPRSHSELFVGGAPFLNHLQIQPGCFFHIDIFDQESGVEGWHEVDAVKSMKPPPQSAQWVAAFEYGLCRQ